MIRFECGESVIEMHPDRIVLAANNIHMRASKEVLIESEDAKLAMHRAVVVSGKNVDVVNNDFSAGLLVGSNPSALLFADQTEVRGSAISLGQPQPLDVPRVQGPERPEDQPANVKLELTHHATDDSEPIADTRYRVIVGEYVIEGRTDGDGKLEFYAPDDEMSAELIVMANETFPDLYPHSPLQYFVSLQAELPATDVSEGVVVRLANLGYEPSMTMFSDDPLDAASVEALRAFQFDHRLPETGESDDATKDKLQEVYGS
jgi:hypothetical protein